MDRNSRIDFPKTIGVAVGKGASSMEALKWALDNENLRRGATLHLLHVYSPGPVRSDNADLATLKKFQEKRNKDVENLISRYTRECDENEVKTEVHNGENDAVPEELVQLIRKFRITRIVIGPSKTNLLAKLTRRGGRIASYVSKHTKYDCEVVRLRHSRKGIVAAVRRRSIASKRKTPPQASALAPSLPSSSAQFRPSPNFSDLYSPDGDGYSAFITVSRRPQTERIETLPRSRSVGKDTSTLSRSHGTTTLYANSTRNTLEQMDSPRPAGASQTNITGNDRELTESDLDFTTVITPPAEGTRESSRKSSQNGLEQQIDRRGPMQSHQESNSAWTPPTAGTTNSAANSREFLDGWRERQTHLEFTSVFIPPAAGTIEMNGTWNDEQLIDSPRETRNYQDFTSKYNPFAASRTTSASSSETSSHGGPVRLDRLVQNYQDSTYGYMSLAAGTRASDGNVSLHQTGSDDNFTYNYYAPSALGTSPSGMNSTWNDPQLIELIQGGNVVVDQDSLEHEIQVSQNEIHQATFPVARMKLEAGQQVNDVYHADTFVADAEKIIVESQRQRRDALREAEAAKLQWLEAARKCQEISQEKETLRKDCQSKVDALTNVIEGYKKDVASARKEVKDERTRCKELQKTIEELSSELEKEKRRRNEAEERATKESAMKEEALAALRKPQQKYTEFSMRELEIATNNFDEGNKLGEGGYGAVFKGKLLHTPVAVKVRRREGVHGREEFQREVELLNNLHHPHLLMLMGACPERGCIVYEYMSNGSLEDRLACKGGTPPLPWYLRFRICAEVATALLFLHSRPVPIVHRDMKPGNILLDQNYVSKIGDVGIAKLVSSETQDTAVYEQEGSVLKGTMAYMDPDYQRTGIVTCQSDVYALGIVMLRLLTGVRAFGVTAMVEDALEKQQLHRILDKKAGEWPLEEANCLARISLQCTEPKTRHRPDLEKEVLPILEKLRAYGDQTASNTSSSRSTLSDSASINNNLSSSSHSKAIFTKNPFHLGGRRSS